MTFGETLELPKNVVSVLLVKAQSLPAAGSHVGVRESLGRGCSFDSRQQLATDTSTLFRRLDPQKFDLEPVPLCCTRDASDKLVILASGNCNVVTFPAAEFSHIEPGESIFNLVGQLTFRLKDSLEFGAHRSIVSVLNLTQFNPVATAPTPLAPDAAPPRSKRAFPALRRA